MDHPSVKNYALTLKALHDRWSPHAGQIRVGSPLISGKCSEIFVQAGRNFGKTELVCYLLWRWAQTFPGSENYYFSPYMKQSREILWASGRLQQFGPRDWLEGDPNNTEMRLRFKNGSFIKLDGSDNVESYRGVKPKGLSVFDEFKDFRPEFYVAYEPNLVAHKAPLFIIGTPPEEAGQFNEVADSFSKNPSKRFFKAPTAENPHLSKEWLTQKKEELYARGEGDVWEREYEANFVRGGANKIFPMLKESFIKPHAEILKDIERDSRKLNWYLWADPAAASCFAVLFAAVNPYTKHWYFLDEIYETSQAEMTVQRIGRRIIQKRDELFRDRWKQWRQGYDEAETWFMNEMFYHFDESFEPTQKMKTDKATNLTLIKDIMLRGKITISDRCQKLFWELDHYRKDDNGKIEKKNDHLIDCLRYILCADNYTLLEELEYHEELDDDFRGAKISDDFPHLDEAGFKDSHWESLE